MSEFWIAVVIALAIICYPIAYVFGWSSADDGTIAAGCLFIIVSVIATAFAAFINERD